MQVTTTTSCLHEKVGPLTQSLKGESVCVCVCVRACVCMFVRAGEGGWCWRKKCLSCVQPEGHVYHSAGAWDCSARPYHSGKCSRENVPPLPYKVLPCIVPLCTVPCFVLPCVVALLPPVLTQLIGRASPTCPHSITSAKCTCVQDR